jgi:glycosyltransferase involved in cell wall biosynthesis
MTNDNQKRFYLIFPNIFGFKGGIQVYSAFLLQALQQLYPEAYYDVFLKYDSRIPKQTQFLSQTKFHGFGDFERWIQNLLITLKIIILGFYQKPHLMILTHINYGVLGYILHYFMGTKYWIIAHGDEVWELKNIFHKWALKDAEKVIAVSHYTRQRLLNAQGLNPEKVMVLPNTFDAQQFQIAEKPTHLLQRYGLSPKQPIILTVSRLGKTAAPHKGYYQVLQALVQVRQQFPDVHYFIVGKGDARPQIESLVQQLDLKSCVTLTGFISDEELCSYYNLCDIFALPSSIEGFGIVYLEALACGKPVLAGNVDGSVDPLEQGKLGCLVNPRDVDAIAENLIQILNGSYANIVLYQPTLLRQKTLEKFDFSQFKNRLFTLIE